MEAAKEEEAKQAALFCCPSPPSPLACCTIVIYTPGLVSHGLNTSIIPRVYPWPLVTVSHSKTSVLTYSTSGGEGRAGAS